MVHKIKDGLFFIYNLDIAVQVCSAWLLVAVIQRLLGVVKELE